MNERIYECINIKMADIKQNFLVFTMLSTLTEVRYANNEKLLVKLDIHKMKSCMKISQFQHT